MIHNLSIYNSWKRSTLDRLTDEPRRAFEKMIRKHLETVVRPLIERAIELDHTTLVSVHTPDFEPIFEEHRDRVVHVAVSDGIQEVSPEKQLALWTKHPWWARVETTLADPKHKITRKKVVNRVRARLKREDHSYFKRNIRDAKKSYLDTIRDAYNKASKNWLSSDDPEDTEEQVKDLIKTILDTSVTRATTIFRTETTRYFNDARHDYFKTETDVDFTQLIAITDGRTSRICEDRDMYVVPLKRAGEKQFKPPFHPNCRTIQSPLDTSLKSDAAEVRKNLGQEFGTVVSGTSDLSFTGKRKTPKTPLPRGWTS